jgi:tetratricopeptide (TPR) repeat protein
MGPRPECSYGQVRLDGNGLILETAQVENEFDMNRICAFVLLLLSHQLLFGGGDYLINPKIFGTFKPIPGFDSPEASLFRKDVELGIKALEEGNFLKAEELLTKCINIIPTNAQLFEFRALAHLESWRFNAAIADANRAIKAESGSGNAHLVRGTAYMIQKLNDQAMSDFSRAISANPTNGEYFNARGKLHLAMGEFANAESDFKKSLQLTPGSSDGFASLQHAKVCQGQADAVIENCNAAINTYSNVIPIHLVRAQAFEHKEMWAEAVVDYSRIIELTGGTNYVCFYTRGFAQEKLQNYQLALDDITRALTLEPDKPEMLGDRGYILGQLGRHAEGIKDCMKAVNTSPKDWNVHNNLAWLLAVSPQASDRDGALARKHAITAINLTEGTNVFALGTYAAACAESGLFEEAIKYQRRAIRIGFPPNAMKVATNALQLYENGKPYRNSK